MGDEREYVTRLLRNVDGNLQGVAHSIHPPPWVVERYRAFQALVSADERTFPCYFATRAESKGVLRYSYLDTSELTTAAPLGDVLRAFLGEYSHLSVRSALIVFVRTSCNPFGSDALAQYEATFWDIVSKLNQGDDDMWPSDVPDDVDDPRWVFCFAGEPIFVTGHCPAYVNRLTRHAASDLLLVIQPRANLHGIAGYGPGPDRVRKRIRSLVSQYDTIAPAPDLGIYGDPDSREWRQFWLPDTNEDTDRRCPVTAGHGPRIAGRTRSEVLGRTRRSENAHVAPQAHASQGVKGTVPASESEAR